MILNKYNNKLNNKNIQLMLINKISLLNRNNKRLNKKNLKYKKIQFIINNKNNNNLQQVQVRMLKRLL